MKNQLAIILLLVLFSGCSIVVSKHPVGIEPYVPPAKQLEGIWISENEAIKIKVVNESNGIIKFAWVESDESDFKLGTVTGKLMKGNNGVYINSLGVPGEDFGGYYIWGKIQFKNNEITIWPPSFKSFNLAFINDEIKALVKKNANQEITTIQLIDEPKIIIDLVENKRNYFDWNNPITLIKLVK